MPAIRPQCFRDNRVAELANGSLRGRHPIRTAYTPVCTYRIETVSRNMGSGLGTPKRGFAGAAEDAIGASLEPNMPAATFYRISR